MLIIELIIYHKSTVTCKSFILYSKMGFEHLVDAVDHPYYKERPLLPRIVFIQGSSCKQFSPLTKTRVKVIQDRIGPYYVSPKDEKGIRKAHGIGIFSNKGEDQLTFVSGDQDEFLTRSSLREFWDPHLSPDGTCIPPLIL